ncbi:hypothetical protein RCCS2_10675 [Roseobacter sp. CCS2]|nr:hypothetical protein RCCS2_10675 [Roseobacter sp. CCS2]
MGAISILPKFNLKRGGTDRPFFTPDPIDALMWTKCLQVPPLYNHEAMQGQRRTKNKNAHQKGGRFRNLFWAVSLSDAGPDA